MDPLSQGVLGAALPQALVKKKHLKQAGLLGFFGGLLPDLDVLIRSSTDPLLYLEFHRQFTHSLIFIPVGGLIGALFVWLAFYRFREKWQLKFFNVYLYVTLGYATHGLLDSCTTYGTQLFWPFSSARVAWNCVSIIDPLFTIPALVFVLLAAFKSKKQDVSRGYAWVGRLPLIWAVGYLGIGAFQQSRGTRAAVELAHSRGHIAERADAKPSFGNILLWKLTYEHEGRFYVDAVRLLSKAQIIEGTSVERFNLERDLPGLDPNSQQARDIERFRWFSNDHLAIKPGTDDVVADMRYSMLPNEIDPLWGIKIDLNQPGRHVSYETYRDLRGRSRFFSMLFYGKVESQ